MTPAGAAAAPAGGPGGSGAPAGPPAEGGPVALRFGGFELRLDSGELSKGSEPVKLQPRPVRVLAILARAGGSVVSRDEIRRAVWGEETYIDFDLALNFCIRQIRAALGDTAEEPRFVATLPRRGYRFLMPVEVEPREPAFRPAGNLAATTAAPPAPADHERLLRRRWRLSIASAIALLALVGGLVALRGRHRPRPAAAAAGLSTDAAQAYADGLSFQARGQEDRALRTFQRTTILAPDFAPAYASLALQLLSPERPCRQARATAEAAERRALALDPRLALAHVARAVRLFRFELDPRGAEQELRRALELDPANAPAHYGLARSLAARGRHDEALAEVERARALEPARLGFVDDYPWFFYLARRYDEAIEQAERWREAAPATPASSAGRGLHPTRLLRILAELGKGDPEAALAAAHEEARRAGEPPPGSLRELWAREERSAGGGALVAAIELGERERAAGALLAACRERASFVPFLAVDPLYDPLRKLPRFAEALRCAHLEGGPSAGPA